LTAGSLTATGAGAAAAGSGVASTIGVGSTGAATGATGAATGALAVLAEVVRTGARGATGALAAVRALGAVRILVVVVLVVVVVSTGASGSAVVVVVVTAGAGSTATGVDAAGGTCVVASWATAMVEGSAKAATIAVALARALSCFIIMPSQRAAAANGHGLSTGRCLGALGATFPLPCTGAPGSGPSGGRSDPAAGDSPGRFTTKAAARGRAQAMGHLPAN